MILRVAILQALLLGTGAVLQLRTGFLSVGGVAGEPFGYGQLGSVVALVIVLYAVALLFMGWKFDVQPRLNGFRFNSAQNPETVESELAGLPIFYDITESEFSWVADLEAGASEIIGEVRDFLAGEDNPEATKFHTAYHNTVLSLGPTWKTLNLLSYGTVNSDLLPRTVDIISRVPNVFTCNLSKLGAHAEVKPHAGESTSYVRCHLGIDIPAPAPLTALHVGGEVVSWEEGRVLAFCDGHWHGAYNHSDDDRFVMIFDIMPESLAWYTKQFCALMVAFNVTQHLLPGRLNLDEPMWRPRILLGYAGLATLGVPLFTAFYVYFRYLCRTRPKWVGRLSGAGFGFYY